MPAALTPGVIPWESIGMAAADVTKPLAGTVPTPADDYDTPWKDVSGRFFPQLVEFFAPDLYAIIDWSAGYEFLEQELRAMLRDAETGPRRVDKVVKVRTLAGQPLYLVLHVEIQVSRESGFPRRMFVYYYRLYDLYPEQVVSLAVPADEEPDWEPKRYEHTLRRSLGALPIHRLAAGPAAGDDEELPPAARKA
jgi:hypothetical protein